VLYENSRNKRPLGIKDEIRKDFLNAGGENYGYMDW